MERILISSHLVLQEDEVNEDDLSTWSHHPGTRSLAEPKGLPSSHDKWLWVKTSCTTIGGDEH